MPDVEEKKPRKGPPPVIVFLIALGLLVVGVAGAIAAVVVFIHQHREDVAALHHDPSYRYGLNAYLNGHVPYRSNVAHTDCETYLKAHPARFAGYTMTTAVRGCIDGWNVVND